MTSIKLASNKALASGGVSTSKAAFSASILALFSFRVSLCFLAAAARSADSISSRTDHEPHAEAEPEEQEIGEAWDEKDGREYIEVEVGVRREMVETLSEVEGR